MALSGTMGARHIAYIAVFSVVAGIIFTVTSHVLVALVAPFGHLGIAAIYGFWFVGGTLVGYIVRRPGAAFLGETLGAIVELLMLSQYSWMLFYYGPAQGAMSELAFALRRYRNWGYGTMALAGALPVLAAYPWDCLVSPFYPACRDPGYPLELHLAIIATMVASGITVAGLLVKYVVDRARLAGAL